MQMLPNLIGVLNLIYIWPPEILGTVISWAFNEIITVGNHKSDGVFFNT